MDKLEDITISQISQSQKDKYSMTHLNEVSRNSQIHSSKK